MALPFTDTQRDDIRARLIESAQRHALSPGVHKTSLDALTADAGISKSSFYKFYQRKEHLFLEVAARWEATILETAMRTLETTRGQSDKQRAATVVFTAFQSIHELGVARFLMEDLPLLFEAVPEERARQHYLSSADMIFSALQKAHIRFTAPEDVVRSVIKLMFLSLLSMRDIGSGFFPALHLLVQSACDRVVA